MAKKDELREHLLKQVSQTHERFATLMEKRLAGADVDDVERYFAMFSTLVAKLEEDDKTLRDVLKEMAAEYAAVVLAELNR